MLSILAALVGLTLAVCVGSVFIDPRDTLSILANQLFGTAMPEHISAVTASILWKIRVPRVLMAFVVGAALSVSGAVMQSVLRNPLASSYTLGVSAGASLGAALVILLGLSFLGIFTLPMVGFVFGMAAVFIAMGLITALDRNMENNTIILMGMVFSLFVDAVLTMITALSNEHLKQLVFWRMGSFAGNGFDQVAILTGIVVLAMIFLMQRTWEMDLMTFGEEQALSAGVSLKRVKFVLIGAAALLTGASVSFTGTIGFIDLIAPHVVRRVFGAKHRLVIPMSALFGGTFMVFSDLLARTMLAPLELPVGAVTALAGAPFFAYVYFARRKKA